MINYINSKITAKVDLINIDTLLISDYGFDSLQLIELIVWIENETAAPVKIEELLHNNDLSIKSISNTSIQKKGISLKFTYQTLPIQELSYLKKIYRQALIIKRPSKEKFSFWLMVKL